MSPVEGPSVVAFALGNVVAEAPVVLVVGLVKRVAYVRDDAEFAEKTAINEQSVAASSPVKVECDHPLPGVGEVPSTNAFPSSRAFLAWHRLRLLVHRIESPVANTLDNIARAAVRPVTENMVQLPAVVEVVRDSAVVLVHEVIAGDTCAVLGVQGSPRPVVVAADDPAAPTARGVKKQMVLPPAGVAIEGDDMVRPAGKREIAKAFACIDGFVC